MDPVIHDRYAIYHGDCMDVMRSMPAESVHLSVYSPPFAGLYHYSSDERDLSNCLSRSEFFEHYAYIVRELYRITLPGRCSAVHVTDIPNSNTGCDTLYDLPGDTIRLHEREGWAFVARHTIWKEPLAFRNRTMTKNLAHATLVADGAMCGVASADYLLIFRKAGENPVPVAHPTGLDSYAGETEIPGELRRFKGWKGKQTENRFSHWIWRQYASSVWDDVRLSRVLPFHEARGEDDEKHVHPLQLDVIERAVVLRSNPGETVFTPFMGVGSEVYGAVVNGRRGFGAELKESYFRQAVANLEVAVREPVPTCSQGDLFSESGQ
jgi:DNA modification methylase